MKLTNRKGFNFFRSYYDVYNELSNEDKIAFMDALLDRQFLGTKPTDLKGMSKFAYISQTNSIDSQVKGYEHKTGKKLTPTVGGSIGGQTPPTRQEEVEEKEEVQVEVEGKDKKKVFNFRKELLNFGFKEKLILDWLKVRKTKKATNSETALKIFLKEVQTSSLEKNEILKICIERDWKSFKNEWIKEKSFTKKENDGRYITEEIENFKF